MNLWDRFLAWLKALFGGGTPPVPPSELIPLRRNVLLITFDPRLPSQGDQTLSQHMHWNDVDDLAKQYIADLYECSGGLVEYNVVRRQTVNAWPVKKDGFSYDATSYLACLENKKAWHKPDEVSYEAIIQDQAYEILSGIQTGKIDEVWLFAFPYAGFWESIMGGPGAIRCNSPSTLRAAGISRRFVVMGFNYQRGVGEMLESFGHRAESTLEHVWSHSHGDENLWQQFSSHFSRSRPRQTSFGCGTVHCPPNTDVDYDWGNPRPVSSNCDYWLGFPESQSTWRQVDRQEWGCGEIRAHHKWWLQHLPKAAGITHGIANNWWLYVVDPDTIP